MDKEAQEKIKNYAAKWFDRGRECGSVPITKDMLMELEGEGEELLEELGHHKLKDKPPLLSEEEIKQTIFRTAHPDFIGNFGGIARGVAQAQRDSDIKWYEGVKDD